MASFQILPSGSIRVLVTINGKRYTQTTKYKASKDKWVDQRVAGKNSHLINQELDRIEEEVKEWIMFNPIQSWSDQNIKTRLKMICHKIESNSTKRKSIETYFKEFMDSKKNTVNPKTNRLVNSYSITDYKTAFDSLINFRSVELEEVDFRLYNDWVNQLNKSYKTNTVGKYIRKVKSFFLWCESQGLPVNPAYKNWKSFSVDTEEDTRALNSEQLNRIYELNVDPVEVYELAKKFHAKKIDPSKVDELTKGIEMAANQMVALASIAPHITDFYRLTIDNVHGDVIKYRRAKTNIQCIAPFQDNNIWHAREFANLRGGYLFESIPLPKLRYYLTYVKDLCNIPFKITPSNFRKTFGSVIYYESNHANKLGVIMKAYGHKKEFTTRKYLGIQDDDLAKDHSELFV